MELTSMALADLYAAKSQAKEKEAHYRLIKNVSPEFNVAHTFWAAFLTKVDNELSQRLYTVK